MLKESTRTGLVALASVAAALTLFVLVFDRYVDYDYRDAECKAGAVTLRAALVGDPQSDEHKGRTSPYRAVLWVTSSEKYFALLDVSLSSKQFGERVNLSDGQRVADMDFKEGSATHTFVVQPLHISYDDYVLNGVLRSIPPSSEVDAPFSCAFIRNQHSEWRMPWLDALMSV